jgi:hypothetical protein
MTEQHAANAMPIASAPPPMMHQPLMIPTITPPTPTQERLSRPHQLVVLFNSSEVQNHAIQDRFLQLQLFRPGEKREVDMIVDELSTLVELSRTDRGYFTFGPRKGQAYPAHPLKILGLPPAPSRSVSDKEAELASREARLATLEAELAEKEVRLNALVK